MFRTIRDWLRPRALPTSGARRGRQPRAARFYHPSFDPLEDRRLLSATASTSQPSAEFSTIIGRSIFYNNSRYDGNNPSADSNDDGAIAIDKAALLPGQTATFANYTSYRGGINGLMVDFAGLVNTPTAADFLFHVGNGNDPRGWADAPAPTSVTIRPGAGVSGSTRVSIIWSDDAIANQWLQVGVRDTPATGLARPDVFYFGNSIGESGDSPTQANVDATDQLAPRNNPRGLTNPVTVLSKLDFNRDGLVTAADEVIAQKHFTSVTNSLQMITPDAGFAWSKVVSRAVFYNASKFDNNNAGANADDDNAIATDKVALLPGGTATFNNYTSYSRGINGLMIDIAGLTQPLTADDFEFRVGNDNRPTGWTLAPQPASVSLRYGAGALGSTRVSIIWPDNAIQTQWLEVTVKATAKTRLALPDVFYFGNAIGETGDSAANALVNSTDVLRVRQAGNTGPTGGDTPFDINRDSVVDLADEYLVAANMSLTSTSLKLIDLAPAPPSAPVPMTAEAAFTDFVSAEVVGRRVFYNNSPFDGSLPGAGAQDDGAIAPDKSALLPGGTASFANYTSYSRGINGIMIDVAGLPGLVSADDFLFRVGNSSDPSQWTAAPRPLSITVRPGAGVGGSARITIIWADNAIQKQWLQVTAKATTHTGLKTPDVFYFGNAIGESGNSATDARVDSTDQLAVRNRPYALASPAPITATNDYNRDGLADAADEWIATRYSTNVNSNTLQLITAPTTTFSAEPQREQIELFSRGDAGYNVFFGPSLVTTNRGTVLAFAEGRSAEDDFKSYALTLRRSADGGQTWSSISTIYSIPPNTGEYIGNLSAVVDAVTGQIFLLFIRNTSRAFVTSSRDDGLTWSSPRDITASVKVTSEGNPNPSAFSSDPWGWFVVGPGHGIQIQQGPFAGRLLVSGDHRLTEDRSGPSWSQVIYSDDHGQTWHLGGGLDQANPVNDYSNESALVEQSDGGLYMTIRVNDNSAFRGYSRSYDGGMTWTTLLRSPQLTTYPVEASMLRVNANTVLLSAPDSSDGTRRQMTIWISHNNMVTWTKTKTVFFGYSGYSDMVQVGPDTVLLAYGRGFANGNSASSIGLARFNLRWLEGADPHQFTWNFNELPPGEQANIQGTSIQDDSLWDNRAQAQANSAAEAPRYVERAGGNTALSLTEGSDSVMLTPQATNALQFGAGNSFTVEIAMRTLDLSGVIIGTRPNVPGWTLQIVDGRVQVILQDQQRAVSLTSFAPVNDGNWHRIAVVRDTSIHLLRMYIDGVAGAATVPDTTASLLGLSEAVRLGAFNDGSGQLAFDVDTLRVSRAALTPDRFLAANFAEPPRLPPPAYRNGSPDTLANLQFWLPSYNAAQNFSDLGFTDPVPLAPVIGTAVHTAIEASPNGYRVTVGSDARKVLYADDSTIGASWRHTATSAEAGQPWTVLDSNGSSASNFDFVQDTGVFTLSTFIKAGSSLGGMATLFDTAESTAVNSGFSLLLAANGSLTMLISGPGTTVRLSQQSPAGLVSPGAWYHVAVVGTGPGNPVTFYVTPVTAAAVVPYRWGQAITGANGNFPTDANHNLSIGGLARTGNAAFDGQMVDQAIYDRALSAAEIQQLFDYTKRI